METPGKRSWWRYLRLSVRGLMLVVLAVAGCLGWWLQLARVQRQAVAAIRGAGGTIWYEWDVPDDPGTPGWRRWVAEHVDVDLTSNVVDVGLSPRCSEAELAQVAQLDRLESLDVGDANMTDAGVASLGRLTRLRILHLGGRPITDAALVHLEALTGLEILSLDRTPVTDAGLVHLKGLANLRILQLASTQVGDTGLAYLEGLASLEDLTLDSTKVGDAGLAHLSRLPRLRMLQLDSTWVTDAGLVHLGGMTNLEELNLAHTQVSGPGLAHLRPLVGLTDLHLSRTPVTDDGLAHLARLTRLSALYLSKTRITDAGLAHLAGLTGLESLSIDGTAVNDAGLRHLEKLTRLKLLMAYDAQVTAVGESQILKALPNLSMWITSPWDPAADAVAKAEKPVEAGGDGGIGSKGRIFTLDSKLVYVNVYSTDPNADQKDLANFANVVVMPRLRRIKGMDVPRNLATGYSALRIRLDPDRMRVHNLSSQDIMKSFSESRIIRLDERLDEAPGKTLQSKEYELIHISRHNKLERYENIVLMANPDGEILRLNEVGRVELAPPFFDISSDIDGQLATAIVLKPLSGWSADIAIEAIEKELEELKAAAFPPGMNFEVIPLDSRDMIYAVIETPQDSTLEYGYMNARCHELGAIARGIDGVTSVSSLAGYDIRTEDHGLGAGTCLIHLKDRSDRKLTSRQIIEKLEENCRTMNVDLEFFEPPAVSVFVAAGGFSVRVLDKTNSPSDRRPGSEPETFMDDLLKRKNLEGLFIFLAGHYPRYELIINNDVARQKGLLIADALENLLVLMGGDVQAEGTFERVAEDFWHRFVKNGRGEMVPYRSFLQLKKKQGVNESDR
jgi:Leucine-rich repeat (LRR) protein